MAREVLTEREVLEMYRDSLNDCYGTVSICGYEYEAGRALEDIDPVAFRCGFSDYWSMLIDDGYTEDSEGNLVRGDDSEQSA